MKTFSLESFQCQILFLERKTCAPKRRKKLLYNFISKTRFECGKKLIKSKKRRWSKVQFLGQREICVPWHHIKWELIKLHSILQSALNEGCWWRQARQSGRDSPSSIYSWSISHISKFWILLFGPFEQFRAARKNNQFD